MVQGTAIQYIPNRSIWPSGQLPQSRLVKQQISKDRGGRTLSLDRNAFEDTCLQYDEVF